MFKYKELEIDEKLLKSLVTLGSVIEARDAYTGGHVFRVGQYARAIGRKIGLQQDRLFMLEVGGLVHDIGKIGTPDAVLNKPGPLNEAEYEMMKHHAVLGRQLVENHPLEQLVHEAVSEHHERLDGRGYPIAKEAQTLGNIARIMAVSDAFDAMTSFRPYRQGMAPEKAIAILMEGIGTQFDGEIVACMEQLLKENSLNEILGHAGFSRKMVFCPSCGPVIAPTTSHGDGHHIMCPACTGDYVLHRHGDTYTVEFTQKVYNLYEPQPDEDAISYIVKSSPKKIKLD